MPASVPDFNLASLNALVWNTDGGRRDTYSILNAIKDEWKFIGGILGIQHSTLVLYEQQQKSPRDCLIEIVHEWQTKFNQDRSMLYKPNWEGLYYLLKDIQKMEEANELKEILYHKFHYELQVQE